MNKQDEALMPLTNDLLRSLGLDKVKGDVVVKAEVINYPDGKQKLGFSLEFEIPTEAVLTTNKPFFTVFKDIQKAIIESPLFKRELGDIQKTVETLKERVSQVQKEATKLLKYKTHYEMEVKLRQASQPILKVYSTGDAGGGTGSDSKGGVGGANGG